MVIISKALLWRASLDWRNWRSLFGAVASFVVND